MKYIFYILLFMFVSSMALDAHAQTTSCDDYNSSDDLQALWPGFGLPFNVFTATELSSGILVATQKIIGATCPSNNSSTGSIGLTFGGNSTNYAIYEKGYRLNTVDNTWIEFDMSLNQSARTALQNGQIPSDRVQNSPYYRWGTASSISTAFARPGGSPVDVYIAAYICLFNGGTYKCGCTDKSCTSGNWVIQKVSF